MSNALWSDDELRSFLSALRGHSIFTDPVDDAERERFIGQARLRLAPAVQRRVLAEIGAVVDADGVARAALEIIEEEVWGKRRTWMLVTPDPWGLLTEFVARGIRTSYRACLPRRNDARVLENIQAASSRTEIAGGSDDSGPVPPERA